MNKALTQELIQNVRNEALLHPSTSQMISTIPAAKIAAPTVRKKVRHIYQSKKLILFSFLTCSLSICTINDAAAVLLLSRLEGAATVRALEFILARMSVSFHFSPLDDTSMKRTLCFTFSVRPDLVFNLKLSRRIFSYMVNKYLSGGIR